MKIPLNPAEKKSPSSKRSNIKFFEACQHEGRKEKTLLVGDTSGEKKNKKTKGYKGKGTANCAMWVFPINRRKREHGPIRPYMAKGTKSTKTARRPRAKARARTNRKIKSLGERNPVGAKGRQEQTAQSHSVKTNTRKMASLVNRVARLTRRGLAHLTLP